jgi:predicted esterase
MQALTAAGVDATEFVFQGGHEWTEAFLERSRQFLDELLNG